jgi:hypothetical protein
MMSQKTSMPKLLRRSFRRGQTLIIAVIILAAILLLGFTFVGILTHNINNGGRYNARTTAKDLAVAGIKYAHDQMLNGTLGADWRGLPTSPSPINGQPNETTDPDALYTRLGSGFAYRADDPSQIDLGGPDGLGFYTRVNFENGRALVRVRYAPGDPNIFEGRPSGTLLQPGRARSYVIIEAVGRPGALNTNDPTTLNATPAQFQGFANSAALQAGMGTLADAEAQYPTSQKYTGFVAIGIIDYALGVWNKDRVSRAMDVGFPEESGATSVYNNGAAWVAAAVDVPQVIGANLQMFNLTIPPTSAGAIPTDGAIHINGDVTINGILDASENYTLGDSFTASGVMAPADVNSTLNLFRAEYEPIRPGFPAAWYGSYPATLPVGSVTTLVGNNLNSRAGFSTVGGILRDGMSAIDPTGFTRNVSYLDPPSMEQRDPLTGSTRYLSVTRDSGVYTGTGNSGRFGHGSGVYIDNVDDLQIPRDDLTRSLVGTQESLVYDWLNPNNAQANSGWQGPFYAPLGSYLLLTSDGFAITRDAPNGNAQHAYWSNAQGLQSNLATLRFRVGLGSDNQVHIVNGMTAGIANINGTLLPIDYSKGPVFNGVLYFEGNVRVRGVIPTDVQLTVVTGATAYIEGSIVRGVVGNDVATDKPAGQLLNRASKSAMMLMARDYVALNTTQFFGPSLGTGYDYPNNLGTSTGVFPIRAPGVGDAFSLYHEFLLDPDLGGAVNAYNPSTWQPYDSTYTAVGGAPITTMLLLSDARDTGTAAATYLSLDVNAGLPTAAYLFSLLDPNNGAQAILGTGYTEPGYTNAGYASVYGLGVETWQGFPQFETRGFPLVTTNFNYNAANQLLTGQAANVDGTFSLEVGGTNDMTFRVNSIGGQPAGAYLLARAASVPGDIRIEASIYAEEGSFYVIPGEWFNPNPNDTRLNYLTKYQEFLNDGMNSANAYTAADGFRTASFGAFPEAPFYGEPIDERVTIYGSVNENVTPPMSQQAEWLKKWGWIPIQEGSPNPAIAITIPASHQANAINGFAPNLSIVYDPVLATGRSEGFAPNNGVGNDPYLRTDNYGRPLAPMPRLPVSPALAYIGEQSF